MYSQGVRICIDEKVRDCISNMLGTVLKELAVRVPTGKHSGQSHWIRRPMAVIVKAIPKDFSPIHWQSMQPTQAAAVMAAEVRSSISIARQLAHRQHGQAANRQQFQ